MRKVLFAVFLLFARSAAAQVPDQLKNTYVNDYAHVLVTGQIDTLNREISKIDRKYNLELAIVLLDTLPKNMSIDELSFSIGSKWEVGKHRNGLVYVALMKQTWHHLEAVNGTIASSAFNNKKSGEILSAMKPYFASKNYYNGLLLLVNRVAVSVAPYAQQGVQQKPMWAIMGISAIIGLSMLIAACIIILCIFLYVKKRKRNNTPIAASA